MAELPAPNQPLINQPKGAAKSKGPQPEIFVMPEKYRGSTLKQDAPKLAQPAPIPVPKPVPAPAKKPLPPAKVAPKKDLPSMKKKKGFPVKLVVIGLIIIALFAAAAIIVLGTLNSDETEPAVTTPITTTPPVTEEEEDDDDVVTPPVEEEVDETEDPFAVDLVPGTDTDSDGLTNIEELLYGTDPQKPDTDADGFLDGNEVFHRYNPSGLAPASLFESGVVRLFDDPAYSYTIFYPSTWTVRGIGGEAEQAVFTATTGEVIQVMISAKVAETTVTDWFLAQDGQVEAADLLVFTTKEGLSALMSPDRLTAYIEAGTKVYVVNYSVGTKPTMDYQQTFQMMLNSLLLR